MAFRAPPGGGVGRSRGIYGRRLGRFGRALGRWPKTVVTAARLPLTRHYVIGRRAVKGFHTTLPGDFTHYRSGIAYCHRDR